LYTEAYRPVSLYTYSERGEREREREGGGHCQRKVTKNTELLKGQSYKNTPPDLLLPINNVNKINDVNKKKAYQLSRKRERGLKLY
jgi:hypothetical protein